jgi:hypothetical protein
MTGVDCHFHEYDTVRVIATGPRLFEGVRAPEVGDQGTIVYTGEPASSGPLVVECIGPDGVTLWLSDFQPNELVLIHRPSEATPK